MPDSCPTARQITCLTAPDSLTARAQAAPARRRGIPGFTFRCTAFTHLSPLGVTDCDPHCGLRAKSKTRNATLTSQSGVLSQQPRSMVLEQRSSSLNPTLHSTEQRLPNKTPLCNLQSGLLLRKTPTEHVRAESRQCNTAQHSGSGQFPRRGCFRLPQSRSPPLLLFRAGLC